LKGNSYEKWFMLTLVGKDRPGIVAQITRALYEGDCNLGEASMVRLVLINPEILSKDGSTVGREGCLSVPEYTGNVARAKFITLRAQNEFGKPHEYQMERYEARAVQHEMDHLDGLLLLDRLVSRRDLFRRQTQEATAPKS
jgi:peptide deformylase